MKTVALTKDGAVLIPRVEVATGLRDRMRGSMLPTSKVLEIGAGIANGLAAHHLGTILGMALWSFDHTLEEKLTIAGDPGLCSVP